MDDDIPVSAWWLRQVRDCLQGPLPSGRIGDVVFLLRDQIDDLLAKRGVAISNPDKAGGRLMRR